MDINTQGSELKSSNTGKSSKAKIIILLVLLLVLAVGGYYFSKKKSTTQKVASIYSNSGSLTIAQTGAILPPGFPIDPRVYKFYATSTTNSGLTKLNANFTVPESVKDINTIYTNYLKDWKPVTLSNGKQLNNNSVIAVTRGKEKLLILFSAPIFASADNFLKASSTPSRVTSTSSAINKAASPIFSNIIINYEK